MANLFRREKKWGRCGNRFVHNATHCAPEKLICWALSKLLSGGGISIGKINKHTKTSFFCWLINMMQPEREAFFEGGGWKSLIELEQFCVLVLEALGRAKANKSRLDKKLWWHLQEGCFSFVSRNSQEDFSRPSVSSISFETLNRAHRPSLKFHFPKEIIGIKNEKTSDGSV